MGSWNAYQVTTVKVTYVHLGSRKALNKCGSSLCFWSCREPQGYRHELAEYL